MPIEELRNLGPKSAQMLERAGYTSIDDIRAVGPVQAYLHVKRVWKGASLNLLWALAGAVQNISWQEARHQYGEALLVELEILEGRDHV